MEGCRVVEPYAGIEFNKNERDEFLRKISLPLMSTVILDTTAVHSEKVFNIIYGTKQ